MEMACHSKTLPVKLLSMASVLFHEHVIDAEEGEALADCWTQQTGSLEPSVTLWSRITVMWMRSQCRLELLKTHKNHTNKCMLLSSWDLRIKLCALEEIGFSEDKTLSLPELTCPHFQT